MSQSDLCFTACGEFSLELLAGLKLPPELFAPGNRSLWEDPYVSRQMLAVHLDAAREAASRPHDVIDAEVAWLLKRLQLRAGDAVLDLGCGPGLYSARFAEAGLTVTGLDYSRNSIEHARNVAVRHGLKIEYRLQDYRTLVDHERFQAAFLIYGDLCVLSDFDRDDLLARIFRALVPGGWLVFDVTTLAAMALSPAQRRWDVQEDGFWREGRYLLLEERFIYQDECVSLDQYIVLRGDCRYDLYRVWNRYYTPEAINALLSVAGFQIRELAGDLRGTRYSSDSPWMGVVAQRTDITYKRTIDRSHAVSSPSSHGASCDTEWSNGARNGRRSWTFAVRRDLIQARREQQAPAWTAAGAQQPWT